MSGIHDNATDPELQAEMEGFRAPDDSTNKEGGEAKRTELIRKIEEVNAGKAAIEQELTTKFGVDSGLLAELRIPDWQKTPAPTVYNTVEKNFFMDGDGKDEEHQRIKTILRQYRDLRTEERGLRSQWKEVYNQTQISSNDDQADRPKSGDFPM